jgi:hypothetical protein
MTDIRTRLADALKEHRSISRHTGVYCTCDGWKWSPQVDWFQHLADVLLSLPGIAIVELPDKSDEDGYFITFHPDVSVAVPEGRIDWLDGSERSAFEARKLAAALLAAANAAEAEQ